MYCAEAFLSFLVWIMLLVFYIEYLKLVLAHLMLSVYTDYVWYLVWNWGKKIKFLNKSKTINNVFNAT